MKRNRQIQSAVSKSLEETLVWRQNQEESFERKERELEREEADLQEEFQLLMEDTKYGRYLRSYYDYSATA